ncbi:MAG TPA: N-acetyl-gamma-glutamyl-phosphate reductase, partial [Nitrospiraceae bacterium]|nr:N-acetyl-gamma-glutamyl-phosphate reductase [Nitrospiraceae bacterium]
TGGELLRLIASHPRMEIVAATADKSVGASLPSLFPSLASVLPPITLESVEIESIAKRAEAVFLALPHTKSLTSVAAFLKAGKHVVDLSADYRLKNAAEYERWYSTTHTHQELLKEAVYGLPELYRQDIQQTKLVASPGCYPTAAILQLAPLIAGGFVDPCSIVIDAKSGISGAGRSPAPAYHFPEAHESLEAYKIGQHRHIPEIEQELRFLGSRPRQSSTASSRNGHAIQVMFTPHLVPMNRGILSTAYCRLHEPMEQAQLRALYRDFYKGERFIRFAEGDVSPNPRHVRGANFCDLNVFIDKRVGWVVTVAALDNLIKGAAGQALQAMNLMLGFPEEMGLTGAGVFP